MGAISVSQQEASNEVQPQNISVLETFPFLAQLEWYSFWATMEWSQECACSILNNRHVLTAAGCVSGWSYEARFRRIRAGSSVRNTGGVIFYVQDRINHPDWAANNYDGDVAVVRTMGIIVYTPLIQQASIASPGSWIPSGLRLSQPGWGRVGQQALSNQEVLTAEQRACGRRDGNFSAPFNATVNVLCAIPPTVIASNNDIGSPWTLGRVTVGIVGVVNTVGTYNGLIAADLGKYTEWVLSSVN
ncbi:trypsin delta-like [Pararge aegeria]|uniref:trypsin delta-like n=1 Tax=Pararge aegeria TaxID=116150 RepID=UPI0019D2142F|nr:trypsin delta-like [Pararge aegeria]